MISISQNTLFFMRIMQTTHDRTAFCLPNKNSMQHKTDFSSASIFIFKGISCKHLCRNNFFPKLKSTSIGLIDFTPISAASSCKVSCKRQKEILPFSQCAHAEKHAFPAWFGPDGAVPRLAFCLFSKTKYSESKQNAYDFFLLFLEMM